MTDEQDPPLAVRVHDRLIRGARLKIVVTDEPHVGGVLRPRDPRHKSGAHGRESESDLSKHDAPPAAPRRPPS
jgi:hypothetical protein